MKNFKELRSQLNEDEHTATGKANRSAYTNDVIANLAGERSLNNLNAMLATIARSTFLDPIDAYNKIRVRLNIALLDFTWREVQGKTEVGQYTIPVFVRGVEGSLFLNVNVSLNADSLYVVDARLQTAADIENETLPAIEEEVEQIDELSPALLGRYIKKAGYSASDAANRAGQMRGAGNGKKSEAENNLYKKVIKREKGIERAVDRLSGGY